MKCLSVLCRSTNSWIRQSGAIASQISPRASLKRRSFSTFDVDDNVFGLTEDEKQFRRMISQFLQNELDSQKAYEIDKSNSFPEFADFLRKCGELGLVGVTCPAEYGGSGGSFMMQVILGEEFARRSPSVSLSFGAHSSLCMDRIVRHGTENQKLKYLPRLNRGEMIGCLAMSEAEAGSDVVSMTTRARRENPDDPNSDWILDGSKFWITNGPVADLAVVYAKTSFVAGKPQRGITAFLVEAGVEGFRRGKPLDKLGHRGSPTGEIIFEECRLPADAVLGKEGKGVYVLMTGLDYERLVLASGPVGIMQHACDVVFDYVHQRKAFGQRIGEFQLIQAKMADMYSRLSACRSYVYQVARACDRGFVNPKDCAGVALHAAEAATKVTLDAIQCLGGNGYVNDYPTGRMLRDAKLYEIGGGTSEIRRMIIGRALNAQYC